MRILMAGLLACGLGAGASAAQEGGVPVAHVPDPDLQNLQVLAMWQQILPDPPGHTPGAPLTELRYVVHAPGLAAADRCAAPGMSLVGATAGTAPSLRAEMKGRTEDRQTVYSASVCTTPLDPGAAEVGIRLNGAFAPLYHDPRFYAGQPAPVARMPGPAAFGAKAAGGDALRAVFLSDSGCRGEEATTGSGAPDTSSRNWQDCDVIAPQSTPDATDQSWPLNRHAWQAAALEPDFVMHGGDYHYFFEEQPYWKSGAGQDRLEYWFQEFLLPVQPLLLTAPFAFGRGNHEVCDFGWFGPGWLALFHSGDETFCGARNLPDTGWSVASWRFTVAPRNGTASPYTVWMIDSGDTGMARENGRYDPAAAKGRDKLWVTHYPAVKNEYYSIRGGRHIGDDLNLEAINAAVQTGCAAGASCWPNMVLSGHQHLFQHLALSAKGLGPEVLTDVYVAGHGGVRMDSDGLPAFANDESGLRSCGTSFADDLVMGRDDVTATTQTARAYGFLLLTRDAASAGPGGPQSGWEVTPQWYLSKVPQGGTAADCDVFAN
ncbi:metallophosphoesterase [Aestuariicoccus sp. MJ-SS9]|uniref:metallophosphoesterase n=1 Tax=Aestuariicoccus sp. MJ-SS9 TaxID=3079855 RepID=UPI00290E70F6|nr:metallophosphoesterase [Aestuariicoccus sp. MJ-SS9]MDU8909662.1 metallophosphoesterase [Aestuariicoccus sp. MJ-SS9]